MFPTAIDSETHLIRPAKQSPELVCVSIADEFGRPQVFNAANGIEVWRAALSDPRVLLIGHNVAFDVCVALEADPSLIPLAFQAYRENRITDTLIRERLLHIANVGVLPKPNAKVKLPGGSVRFFTLAALAWKYLQVDRSADKAADAWRMRYHELSNQPLAQWPAAAIEYPKQDAADTLGVYLAQQRAPNSETLADQFHQCRKAFALRLIEVWGIRTDARMVAEGKRLAEEHAQSIERRLQAAGLMRADLSMDETALRARIAQDYRARGRSAPQTPTGRVKKDAETLEDCSDPLLNHDPKTCRDPAHPQPCTLPEGLVQAQGYRDFLSDWLPRLELGARWPFHTRYEPLLVTARTSSSPNIQNPPRDSVVPVRECFVPREGRLFCSVDYNQIELCSLSQCVLWIVGRSDMAAAIRANVDLHAKFACEFYRRDYREFMEAKAREDKQTLEQRQSAKAPNFGFPGGLGARGFVAYAKNNYGVIVTEAEARLLKAAWLRTWPEMNGYFRAIKGYFGRDETKTIRQFGNGRLRAATWYTEACNTLFQGLTADGAGEALFRVADAAYNQPRSAFYGSRPVIFLHDEILAEVPADPDAAHAAAYELSRIMCEAMQLWIPDIPISAEPALMRRWYKGAKTVHDSAGRLAVWTPKKAA